MNWRGRPLTSHEVIVATIAATTSRTGLRVHAELDTGQYSTGVTIGDADMAALPLTRHTFHGDWNYTLHPVLAAVPPAGDDAFAAAWDHSVLSQPALTGMPAQQLSTLTEALTALRDARSGTRAGRPPRLCFADQVLATVLHLRLALPAEPLAVLFGSSRSAVHRTFHNISKLLDQHGTTIAPAELPPSALAALEARVLALTANPNPKIKPAC